MKECLLSPHSGISQSNKNHQLSLLPREIFICEQKHIVHGQRVHRIVQRFEIMLGVVVRKLHETIDPVVEPNVASRIVALAYIGLEHSVVALAVVDLACLVDVSFEV